MPGRQSRDVPLYREIVLVSGRTQMERMENEKDESGLGEPYYKHIMAESACEL